MAYRLYYNLLINQSTVYNHSSTQLIIRHFVRICPQNCLDGFPK